MKWFFNEMNFCKESSFIHQTLSRSLWNTIFLCAHTVVIKFLTHLQVASNSIRTSAAIFIFLCTKLPFWCTNIWSIGFDQTVIGRFLSNDDWNWVADFFSGVYKVFWWDKIYNTPLKNSVAMNWKTSGKTVLEETSK